MQRNKGGRWWASPVAGRSPGRWLAAPLAVLLLAVPGACRTPAAASAASLAVLQRGPVPAASAPEEGAGERAIPTPGPAPGARPETSAADRPPRPPSPDAPALLWRAGRGPLPGLSASQSTRRRGESEMAVATIRAALAPGSAVAEDWARWIEALLRRPADPVWPSVARLVGALELRTLAPLLAPSLAPSDDAPARRLAARLSLHRLLGVWLGSPEEVEPFEAALGSGATEAFVQRLLAEEERSARRLLSLIELDPTRVPPWSEVDDPLLRARIAERMGAALADGRLAPADALDSLIAALADEPDPRAFHAQLEAILVPLSSVADEAELERLFALFRELVEGAWDGRSLSLAQALGRLVYVETSAGEAAWLARALDLAGTALASALEADRRRGFEDPDAVAAVIGSLATLAKRARALEPPTGSDGTPQPGLLARAGARQALLAILRDPLRAEATRQAAGVALGTFVGADEIDLFVAELARDDLPAGLAHVMLGTLGGLLVGLSASDSDGVARALPALERVAVISGSSDPDLRRSALALLSDPRLEPGVRELDPRFLLRRLQREDVAELRRSLFVLLARFGEPAMFEPLLALEGFERLAAEEGANAIELDAALTRLAAGSPERLYRAAARLADGAPPSNVALPRRALALVADVDGPGLAALGPRARDHMIEWVWRLHALGVPLRGGLDARLSAFVTRLLASTPAGAAPAAGLDAARREHLLAVLGAQQAAAGGGSAAPAPGSGGGGAPGGEAKAGSQAILEHFARALALAEAADAPASFVRLVRRDRARHRLASGALSAGLADYRALFEQDPATLEVSDLRGAGRLVAEAAGRPADPVLNGSAPASGGSAGSGGSGTLVLGSPGGVRPSAEEERFAAELLFTLLERNAWASDRVAERLSDLRRLRELVLRQGDPATLERFLALFAGLPASPESDPTDVPRRWRDLAQDGGALHELVELERAVRAVLAGSDEPGE